MSDTGGGSHVGRQLRKTLKQELASVEDHAARARKRPGPAIHEVRKSFKRARALLRLARPGIGEDRFHGENARYRDIGRLLGPARDADVMWTTLKGVLEDLPELTEDDSVQRLRRRLKKERKRTRRDALAPGGPMEKVARRSRVARAAIGDLGLKRVGPSEAASGLARVYRDGAVRWEAARQRGDAGAYHGWRRRTKELLYQLRFLAPYLPPRLVDRIPAQDDLGEQLGLANDWTTLVGLLEGEPKLVPDPERRARIATATLERRNAIWAQALKRGEALYADDPASLEAEVRAALARH